MINKSNNGRKCYKDPKVIEVSSCLYEMEAYCLLMWKRRMKSVGQSADDIFNDSRSMCGWQVGVMRRQGRQRIEKKATGPVRASHWARIHGVSLSFRKIVLLELFKFNTIPYLFTVDLLTITSYSQRKHYFSFKCLRSIVESKYWSGNFEFV